MPSLTENDQPPGLAETASMAWRLALRMPMATLELMEAVIELPGRLEALAQLLEDTNRLVHRAVDGVDRASDGLASAVSGIRRTLDLLEGAVPDLAGGAESLQQLAGRLGGVAAQLADELPKATATLQGMAPELSTVVGTLDERLLHLDTVVTELSGTLVGLIGAIPGVRRTLRLGRNADGGSATAPD